MLNIPKAIVFDYGGTLLRSEHFDPVKGTKELLKFANNPNNVSAETVQSYADKILNDVGAYNSNMVMQINSVELTRLIHSVHNISFNKSFEELDLIFLDAAEGTSKMDGLVELLDFLVEKGVRLAVLSNTGFREESHRYQLRKYGLEKYFEFFIATSDYLIRKPDKRIFELALSKLGLESDDVWYVGNKFEYDIQGAKNANMFPVWINEFEEEGLEDFKYLNVSTYGELKEILLRDWEGKR